MYYPFFSDHTVLSTVLIILILKMGQYVYRLTFHPLAKFPGPRLAGLTSLYGAYYDLCRHGIYHKKFVDLHERYGPIIRIFPNELHVKDMESYNQIFRTGTKFDKDPILYNVASVNNAHVNFHALAPAKARKDLLAPFFSKASILRSETVIQEKIGAFSDQLIAAGAGGPVNLSLAYRCLTIDMITHFCFQKSYDAIYADRFDMPFVKALMIMNGNNGTEKYMAGIPNLVFRVVMGMPRSLLGIFSENLLLIRDFINSLNTHILYLKKHPDTITTSVFAPVLLQEMSKGQQALTDEALCHEALLIVGAGTDTTATTLTIGTYRLLANPTKLAKLKEELKAAMPDKNGDLSLQQAENLPYLRGVVKESLRLSYGAPGRLPRIVPKGGAKMCGWDVPPGTIISSSHYGYHHDESVFYDSHSFEPERWLDPVKATELDRYLVSFSRGSRSCLGMTLAQAELYLGFARIFRKIGLELNDTTDDDMQTIDTFVTCTKNRLQVNAWELEK